MKCKCPNCGAEFAQSRKGWAYIDHNGAYGKNQQVLIAALYKVPKEWISYKELVSLARKCGLKESVIAETISSLERRELIEMDDLSQRCHDWRWLSQDESIKPSPYLKRSGYRFRIAPRRKTAAPENKFRGRAPENKSRLD